MSIRILYGLYESLIQTKIHLYLSERPIVLFSLYKITINHILYFQCIFENKRSLT